MNSVSMSKSVHDSVVVCDILVMPSASFIVIVVLAIEIVVAFSGDSVKKGARGTWPVC